MDNDRLNGIIDDLIEELREVDDGADLTVIQTLKLADYDPDEFTPSDLFQICGALFEAAKKAHIKLDMSKHDGKVEGLIYNLDYIVRNKKAQIKCPYCGSTNTALILRGMPAWSERLQGKLAAGKIYIGGCLVSDNDPERHCNSCKKDFAHPPVLFNRKNGFVEDFRDIATELKFEDGGFSQGHTIVTIRKNGSYADIETTKLPAGTTTAARISAYRWGKILDELYCHMYLHEWKKRYDNPGVLDGEQWSLEVKLTGNRKRTYSGSNAFPPYWKELKAVFKPWMK